ncbi:MAG: hypothetical protein NXH81_01355 [Halieaceae bacterium]|uniref:hypothetical protein n=1 Tax=Haliea alexandrii TaxID=2448162 RepID=UPI0013050349|nr:hypothetical protein [Haliea alexandrii]MCR9184022.1 hypothetical protein [Halieaceae bacterium]
MHSGRRSVCGVEKTPRLERSTRDYPQTVTPPAGAPNVEVILLDDLGFGQPGTYGGPIPTPTRAALLAVRNHYQSGFGTISELSTGYPGYNSVWPCSSGTIAQFMKDHGYSTAAFGQ